MNEKHKVLLLLLKEFDCICRENDIEYILGGGSVLGAIRHKGFIPWDDDADVILTKDNFDKLRLFFENNEIPNRELVHKWNYKEYPNTVARYYATDNTGMQRSFAWDSVPMGQYIDILIMIPILEKKQDSLIEKNLLYVELLNDKYSENVIRGRKFVYKYTFWNIAKKIFGKERILKRFERKIFKYSDDECDCYMIFHGIGSLRVVEKKYVLGTVYVEFEDTMLPIPEAYMEKFWNEYGSNWRIMPPEKEREIHTVMDDFKRPYKMHVEDYIRFVDKKWILRNVKRYKELCIYDGERRRKTNASINIWKNAIVVVELNKMLKENKINLKKLLQEGNYEVINEIFKDYYDAQFDKNTKFWNTFIKLDDDKLEIACNNLIYYTGEYYKAKYILNLRERYNPLLTEELIRLQNVIDVIEKLYYAFDFKRRSDAKAIIEEFYDNSIQIDFVLAKLRIMSEEAQDKCEYVQLEKAAREGLNHFPQSWDFLKYIADANIGLGNIKKAINLYSIVEEKSINGELILDIKRRKEKYES